MLPPRASDVLPGAGPELSVIIPVFNEADNVGPLCDQLFPELDKLGRTYEVIFINDGSADATEERLLAASSTRPRMRVISFRRNFGQTAAIMAGIDHAFGDVIVPMDGDLQNDPRDIRPLLEKLDEGYDVVSGWRKDRQDDRWRRNVPSRLANWLISRLSGVHLRDYGCMLKAYRREILQGFRLYGEMHRFVPIYARWQGARITEIPVQHHARRHGQSKYGLNRIYKVLMDLLLVKFLTQFDTKPIYVFGAVGAVFFAIAAVAAAYAVYLKYFERTTFIQTPLPLVVTVGFITGLMCILLGFLAELLVRIYFESQGKPHYVIREPRAPRSDR